MLLLTEIINDFYFENDDKNLQNWKIDPKKPDNLVWKFFYRKIEI